MGRKRKKEVNRLTERTFVCWVCSRDYPLIELHYRMLRKLTNDAVVYVYDKAEKEGEETPPPRLPKGAVAIGSDFKRRGNLNGKECIANMLLFYGHLGEMGVKNVVKVDADTFLTSIDWIEEGKNCGFHSSNGFYFTGCAYSLTMPTIMGILEFLKGHDIEPQAGYTLPEDQTITILSSLVRVDPVVIRENGEFLCVAMMNSMRNQPDRIRGVRGAIHCGQWQRIDPLVALGLDRTDIVKSDLIHIFRQLYRDKRTPPIFSAIPEHSFIAKKKPLKN